jgi:hypothetical protein
MMRFAVPDTMKLEHEDLDGDLTRAAGSGGRTGAVARQVARLLHPHFMKEEDFALPPLGLLPALASGRVIPEMRGAIAMADRLKRDLGRMREEHRAVVQALRALADSAHEEGKPECIGFARRFTLHARAEEEIFYPAAILVGEYLKLRLGDPG